jgi:hypothetical protein
MNARIQATDVGGGPCVEDQHDRENARCKHFLAKRLSGPRFHMTESETPLITCE